MVGFTGAHMLNKSTFVELNSLEEASNIYLYFYRHEAMRWRRIRIFTCGKQVPDYLKMFLSDFNLELYSFQHNGDIFIFAVK